MPPSSNDKNSIQSVILNQPEEASYQLSIPERTPERKPPDEDRSLKSTLPNNLNTQPFQNHADLSIGNVEQTLKNNLDINVQLEFMSKQLQTGDLQHKIEHVDTILQFQSKQSLKDNNNTSITFPNQSAQQKRPIDNVDPMFQLQKPQEKASVPSGNHHDQMLQQQILNIPSTVPPHQRLAPMSNSDVPPMRWMDNELLFGDGFTNKSSQQSQQQQKQQQQQQQQQQQHDENMFLSAALQRHFSHSLFNEIAAYGKSRKKSRGIVGLLLN